MSLRELSPLRAVWTVAWPMAALGILRALYLLTDSYWIGQLGSAPLAAVGGAAFGWWIIMLACELAATGAHSRVSRHVGAQREARIPNTLASAAALSVVIALVLLAAYPFRALYFDLLGFARGSAEMAEGTSYLGASLLGALSLALHAVVGGAFRGLGDTRTALALTASTLVINAALDPWMIWGGAGVPAFGIAGAAWATAIANLFGAVVGVALLVRRGIALFDGRPSLTTSLDVARIGAPIAGSGAGFALVYVLLCNLIARYGPEHIAALGVGHRLEGLAYLTCMAFGIGAATMVGQHTGAEDPRAASHAARAATRLALLAMTPFTVGYLVFAEALLRLFTDDPAIVDAGVDYLRVQTAVLFFMALEEVHKGAFTGTGRTLAAAAVSFSMTALRLPAAWVLAVPLGLGIDGVWTAIAASTALKGGLMALLWRSRGRSGLIELSASQRCEPHDRDTSVATSREPRR